MRDGLLAAGLACFYLGTIVSVLEEWRARGLTDTSIRSLLLWVVGNGLLAWWGYRQDAWAVGVVTALCAGLFTTWLIWKLSDYAKSRGW